jgi:hypothetical protein
MVKLTLGLICCLVAFLGASAQETIEVNRKMTRKITEVYHVLINNMEIKQGLYQARHDKNMALASGLYANNKRIGLWHFFSYDGTLLQNFDYGHNLLTYEAPEDERSVFKYKFDRVVTKTDTVTKPIKIGGRYFGYLPLLLLFKKPEGMYLFNNQPYIPVTIELLVSPAGNLADYTLHVYERVFNFNLDLLNQEDKIFLPATINGQTVTSTIMIYCKMDIDGNITL